MENEVVKIWAEVLDEREVKGTKMIQVKIPSKPNPIWVEESDLAE